MAPTTVWKATARPYATARTATPVASGSAAKAIVMPAMDATITGRKPRRSATQPPTGEQAAPRTGATPSTRPDRAGHHERRVRDVVDEQGQVLRRHLAADEDHAVDEEQPAHDRVGQDASDGGEGKVSRCFPSARPPAGPPSTPRPATAPRRSTGRPRRRRPRRWPRWSWSIMNSPRAGPAPKPSGLLAAKMPIARPRRCDGATSRIAAIITPLLPSWKPTRSIATTSCQGARLAATTTEDDRLHERAADDHRLAAVLVGPDAPERDQAAAPRGRRARPGCPRSARRRARSSQPRSACWAGTRRSGPLRSPSTNEANQYRASRERQSGAGLGFIRAA